MNMVNAILGKKLGMTQVFAENGDVIPVTVLKAGPCVVVQRKTSQADGYDAAQLGLVEVPPPRRVKKPMEGHFKKGNANPVRFLREVRLAQDGGEVKVGDKVLVDVFAVNDLVDVVGISKGRGFAGNIKRHHFMRGRESHGNTNVREHGSIGSNTYPAHVFKGLRMAGHLGNGRVTTRNLGLFGIDKEAGLVFIKGAVPGATRGIVFIRKSAQGNTDRGDRS